MHVESACIIFQVTLTITAQILECQWDVFKLFSNLSKTKTQINDPISLYFHNLLSDTNVQDKEQHSESHFSRSNGQPSPN